MFSDPYLQTQIFIFNFLLLSASPSIHVVHGHLIFSPQLSHIEKILYWWDTSETENLKVDLGEFSPLCWNGTHSRANHHLIALYLQNFVQDGISRFMGKKSRCLNPQDLLVIKHWIYLGRHFHMAESRWYSLCLMIIAFSKKREEHEMLCLCLSEL